MYVLPLLPDADTLETTMARDVHVHETGAPPPRGDGGMGWVVVAVLVVVVLLLVFFVFTRGPREGRVDRTDVDVTVPQPQAPETRAPTVEVPERIEVEVPDVDVEVRDNR
jgi:hypothetical protein